MLPKRGDIVKVDAATEAQPVRSSGYGSFSEDGEKQTILEDTLLRFMRIKDGNAVVQVVNRPTVRKMLRTVAPELNQRQTYLVDAYAVSFHCKRDDWVNENKNSTVSAG